MLMMDRPYLTLSTVFAAWKTGLFAIAIGSQVGPTYDTSSGLLLLDSGPTGRVLTRLTSWDAIYFVKVAQRGYLFEQEWAFGSALPKCISGLIQLLAALGLVNPSASNDGSAYLEALVGVLFTNVCHYLSALVLYQLGRRLLADSRWALCAALLHVLSPAGLFLSAPYAESPFALLSFVGWLLLVASCTSPSTATSSGLSRDALTLLSGIVFGIATVFRTNGLLNGTPFAFEFLSTLYHLVEDIDYAKTPTYLRRLVVLGLSGLSVAAGSLVPQFVAWRLYCSSPDAMASDARPSWCLNLIPSIYDHVQYKYWNNGFLLYWTLPNFPLFLLAGPMLFIMGKSGKDLFFQAPQLAGRHKKAAVAGAQESGSTIDKQTASVDVDDDDAASSSSQNESRLTLIIQSMVASQVILVFLAFTRNHVQIITRLSSGYPAWYWWVAACLRSPKTRNLGGGVVMFMVMYACIQGVLFASFLPPA